MRVDEVCGICTAKHIVQPLFPAESLVVKQLLTSAKSRNVFSTILPLPLTCFQKM